MPKELVSFFYVVDFSFVYWPSKANHFLLLKGGGGGTSTSTSLNLQHSILKWGMTYSMSYILQEFTRHVYMYSRAWQGYLLKGYLIIHP